MKHESFDVKGAVAWLRLRDEHDLAVSIQADLERRTPAELTTEAEQCSEPTADAAMIRRLLSLRRLRGKILDSSSFADPCWDILLDLTAATLEGKQVSVSSLCVAAEVPVTTAMRCIKSLTDQGILERRSDPNDRRRSYISLAEPIFLGVRRWLVQARVMLR